jgi:hypothetical protein
MITDISKEQAYEELLLVMEESTLVQNMTEEEREAVRLNYKDASVLEISMAIRKIKNSETKFNLKKEELQKAADAANDELRKAVWEAEKLIRLNKQEEENQARKAEEQDLLQILNKLNNT